MPAWRVTKSFMKNSSHNKTKNIGCVIMASGLGKRFGGNKLMADFGGRPMVSWIIDRACFCFEEVLVVTRNEAVVDLCNSKGVKVVFHEFPFQSDTVRLGIENMCNNVTGVVFSVADQPFLSIDTLEKIVVAATKNPDYIWRVGHKNTVGSPIYFSKKYFEELKNLPEDKGGSFICRKYPDKTRVLEIDNSLELKDIDTRNTYEEFLDIATQMKL